MPVPRDDVDNLIYGEQVRVVYAQVPIAVVVNIVNGALTAIVLASVVTFRAVVIWLGLLVLGTIARGALWAGYRGARNQIEDARRWAAMAASSSAISGALWGVGGAVLLPDAVFPQMFLVFVIGGMCVGAVGISSAHFPTLLAFLLSASLPIAARFLLMGTLAHAAMAGMIVVFVTALSLVGLNFNRSIARTLRLGFELTERTRALDQASARLQAEIAERRSTEAALRQAQKLEAIGRLTGGIAHDFNNLLTAVIGNLDVAIRQSDERLAPLLHVALRAAERGAALTQRLLTFARKQRLDPKPVDVAALILGIEDMLELTLGPTIRLVISLNPDAALVLADANQLELAILNIAINGRDAMPAGGVLEIGLENRRHDGGVPSELGAGDFVVVSIADTGTGMDEATLSRLGEPFFTTKEVGKGSGLGLATVHGFAAQSGGAVNIQSALGKGTTVEVWLPRATAAPPKDPGDAQP